MAYVLTMVQHTAVLAQQAILELTVKLNLVALHHARMEVFVTMSEIHTYVYVQPVTLVQTVR